MKAGFENKKIEQELEIITSDETISLLKEKGIIEAVFNFEDYASCYSSLTVSASYSDKDIVSSTSEKLRDAKSIDSDASDEEDIQSYTRSTMVTR